MNDSQDQLERDLRAALRAAPHAPVSADAWQQNQRRLAESRSRRGSRLLAAAAVVAVLLIGGLVAVANRGGDSGTPANGGDGGSNDSMTSDDVFADPNLLGPIAEVERLQVDGEPAVHEAALSDTSGKGPSLCDRVVAASSGSEGCTSRDELADEPAVAFDWLTGTTGGGNIRGVLAGVDSRVIKVQIWMDNGDMTLANLKPTGWEDTKMFALTVPADGPRPQRLVAYSDASGTVVQAVDLPSRFGADWRRAEPDCGNRADAPTLTHLLGPGESTESATVRFGYANASVHVVTAGLGLDATACLPLKPGAIAGASVAGSIAVVVVAPEVSEVRVRSLDRDADIELIVPERTLWRVAVAHDLSGHDLNHAEVIAYDGKGNELGREFVNQPASP